MLFCRQQTMLTPVPQLPTMEPPEGSSTVLQLHKLHRHPASGPAPLLRDVYGTVLRRERRRQRRTLEDVASRAGVSIQYLSEIERGRKEASSEILAAVCASLGSGLAAFLAAAHRELAVTERRPVLDLTRPVPPSWSASTPLGPRIGPGPGSEPSPGIEPVPGSEPASGTEPDAVSEPDPGTQAVPPPSSLLMAA
jgi:DNA-binding XRE family transcriptional regulator